MIGYEPLGEKREEFKFLKRLEYITATPKQFLNRITFLKKIMIIVFNAYLKIVY